jgi:diguanylate cyclase (GGDEF)-like protein/PAS domain S-box-containing protein
MGAGAVLSMAMNFEVGPGVSFDLRATPLALAGFFGGPLAGAAAALIGLAYRGLLGGVGVWAGCASVLVATTIGIAGHRASAGREASRGAIVLLGLATAAGVALTLLLLPRAIWPMMLPVLAGPGTVLSFAATLLAGLAMRHEDRLRELIEVERFYRSVVEMLPDCLNSKTLDGRFTTANAATARMMRAASAADLIGKTDFDFYPRATAERFRAEEAAVIAEGAPRAVEQRIAFADGSTAWLSTLKAPILDDRGRAVGLITHNRDITAKKALQEALQVAHEHLREALEHMADGLVLFDRDGAILLCNRQYARLFPQTEVLRIPGARLSEILRQSVMRGEEAEPPAGALEDWIDARSRTIIVPCDRIVALAGDRWLEARTRRVNGGGSLILFTDITARKRAEIALALANERLARLARCDALTGLSNRRGFDEALAKEFARCESERTPLGLLLVDVDRFKAYNDCYGHQAGDLCLQRIAEAIRSVAPGGEDLAARYGGEEFVAILPGAAPVDTLACAERLREAVEALALPHAGAERGRVTVSVGATSHVPDGAIRRPEDLLRRADTAL